MSKPYGQLVLKRYIAEIVKASPEYLEKEKIRQLIQDKIVDAIRSGEIIDQNDLEQFLATADTNDETVAMAVDALRQVPFNVWSSMAAR